MTDLLLGITRLAVHEVPYRRGEQDLIIDNVGEWTESGKRIGRPSLRSGTRRGREKDAQSEEEIAGREIGNGERKCI